MTDRALEDVALPVGNAEPLEWATDADFPGWRRMSCGCCAGIEWGGEEARECRYCRGNAVLWVHLASRRIAAWPGGPFTGVATASEIAALTSPPEAPNGK